MLPAAVDGTLVFENPTPMVGTHTIDVEYPCGMVTVVPPEAELIVTV